MTGDCHAGICGSPGVRSPRATRLRDYPRFSRLKSSQSGKSSHYSTRAGCSACPLWRHRHLLSGGTRIGGYCAITDRYIG